MNEKLAVFYDITSRWGEGQGPAGRGILQLQRRGCQALLFRTQPCVQLLSLASQYLTHAQSQPFCFVGLQHGAPLRRGHP
jgi:hypothetical protein